jgi:hypothetical protein
MNIYSEQQVKQMRPKHFGAWVGSTWTVLDAYKKENAETRFRQLGELKSEVSETITLGSGTPCDEFQDLGFGEYQLQMRQN